MATERQSLLNLVVDVLDSRRVPCARQRRARHRYRRRTRAWDADIVARAEATTLQGRSLPTARVEDVILLKLYAGGSQDRWDIEQLLARPDRDAVVALVDRHVGVLPSDARRLGSTLRLAGR